MKAKFYHLYLVPNEGVNEDTVKSTLNKSLDWFKYDQNVWLLYSTSDMKVWKSRLKPIAGDDGYYFVCEINPSKRTGWMAKSLWDWLKKDRTKK